MLDPTICWQAIYSRDQRFDGRFFAAATTSGLYCRNVCPVPFALPRNIVLFACASAAEEAGFRPCKRCQPQAAPGTPAWLGSSAVVSRALRLVLAGALNEGTVEQLAERLGLGSRQLRRLFVQHLGVSPLKIAATQRIHLAKNLIEESQLPMTEIAFHAGFKSIREFNHAIHLASRQSPSQLRRDSSSRQRTPPQDGLQLRLPYREPFDWKSLMTFFQQRAVPGVEVVTESAYQRTIAIGNARGFFQAKPDPHEPRLIVHLQLTSYENLAQAVERIRRIFDLGADPLQIASHLSNDPRLRQSIQQRPGLRVPGIWDKFECAVLSALGQTLHSPGSTTAIADLVETFGTPIDTGVPGLTVLFPPAQAMAARAVAETEASYVAMRAFGDPDAFPAEESGPGDTDKWRPWRAYAAMHLTV